MNLRQELVKIIQDDEVQRLSLLLKRFSPFDVLRVGHYELRHTNTLAWLLNPIANHGLGDTFLRAFIARLGSTGEPARLAELFETASDHSVTVRREVRLSQLRGQAREGERLGLDEDSQEDQAETSMALPAAKRKEREGAVDILVDGDGWILAIEAKVRSGEGDGQLKAYQAALQAYADQDLLVPVFLTIEGDEPSEPQWTAASWREGVIAPLEKTLEIHQDLQPDIRSFLVSYLATLKRHAGNGDDAEALAKAISKGGLKSEVQHPPA